MVGIAFFDIDGTLTYGISSGAFIADRLGTGDRMRDAEDRYARGEIGNDTVCDIDARGYTGHRVSEIHGWLNDLPLVQGIAQSVAECKSRGIKPGSHPALGQSFPRALRRDLDLKHGAVQNLLSRMACLLVKQRHMPMNKPK